MILTIIRPFLLLPVLVLAFPLAAAATSRPRDPTANIQVSQLSNGMRVVYAPSEFAKTVQIRVRVDAGRWTEETAGLAHLLEHYIFKDAKMDRDMTYLEVIKENGGSGNAYVNDESTIYHATVPPDKAEWLVQTFGKMLVNKKFIEEEIEFAKKPVYLEIGQPNPFHYFLAAINTIIPGGLDLFPNSWETEFGFRRPNRAPIPDQITTSYLRASDIKAFYDRYYNARNTTLFVAGNFQLTTMQQKAELAFAGLPREGSLGVKPGQLTPIFRDHKRSTATSGTPKFEVGTKIHSASLEESIALQIYLEHLAHRLMKEMRNTRGETYTARPITDIHRRSGFVSVAMEAAPENYYKNLNKVRQYIQHEAREGKISPALFKEAMNLFGHKFSLTDQDSETMMALAELTELYIREYGNDVKSPFQIYSSLSFEKYKSVLNALFLPDMEFERTSEPPLLFRYEEVLLTLLGLIAWSALTRRLFARRFRHDQIRWMRKLKYPPAYLGQIFIMLGAAGFCCLAVALVYHLWMRTPYIHSSFLIGDYLFGQITLGVMYLVCQTYLMLVPRKLMIVGRHLVIKSLGYSSRSLPLGAIELVQVIHPLKLLLKPSELWRVNYRFYYLNAAIWQPGLLIKTKHGKNYFFSVKQAPKAAAELNEILAPAPSSVAEFTEQWLKAKSAML